MRHEIVFLGKVKDSFIRLGVEEYKKRLQHYTKLNIRTLKDPGAGYTGKTAKNLQGNVLLDAASGGAFTVALDLSGKQFTSEEFSEQISRWEVMGVRDIYWLIGGPEGHSEDVLKRADLLLSFSKMTFTHDFARLLLLEQLYRAYTIKAKEKYHK